MASLSVPEFDVPATDIDKMFPGVVDGGGVGEVDERSPTGALGFLEESHIGLVREAVAFAGVAGDAGADDVFPSGLAAALTGKNVIEVESVPVEASGAILAGVVVAFIDVLPGEFDFLAGEAVKLAEDDDGGNADEETHGLDHFPSGIALGEVMPSGEVVGEIIVVLITPDDMGVLLVKQSESPADAADVDRLPQPVEYQHMPVEQGVHGIVVINVG